MGGFGTQTLGLNPASTWRWVGLPLQLLNLYKPQFAQGLFAIIYFRGEALKIKLDNLCEMYFISHLGNKRWVISLFSCCLPLVPAMNHLFPGRLASTPAFRNDTLRMPCTHVLGLPIPGFTSLPLSFSVPVMPRSSLLFLFHKFFLDKGSSEISFS